MKDNAFKCSIIISIILLFLISVTVVASADNEDSELNIETMSQSGITIQYPSDWGNSRATSNYSVMAISKIDSIDALGIGQVNINVEKQEYDWDFYNFVNETYDKMQKDSSFQLISSGAVAVGGKDGLEYVYTSSQSGTEKEHKAVWFEKGGQAYVIMYSAPISEFEDNLYVFDFVLSQIQIT